MTTIMPDGETITFTSSADGETPGIYFAFDLHNHKGDSCIVRLSGAQIKAGNTLTAHFDFEKHKVTFKDDDGSSDIYHVEVTLLKADGTRRMLKGKFEEKGGEAESSLNEWEN